MDAVEQCSAATEGDKGGVPVAGAVDAAVGDSSGVRCRGILSVSRVACVGVMKSSISRVGVIRKVAQETGADGTDGSGDLPF